MQNLSAFYIQKNSTFAPQNLGNYSINLKRKEKC